MCLMRILRKVDLSFYGEKTENLKIQSDHRITNYLNKRHLLHSYESNLVISSELEISQIIGGLTVIMYHCLNIQIKGNLKVKEEFNYSLEVEEN